MTSVAGILIIAFTVGFAVLVLLCVARLLRSETTSRLAKRVVCLLAVFLMVLSANFVVRLQSTPTALPINDVLDVTDASGGLSIRSVRMPAPTYVSGTGTIGKSHVSGVTVEVANHSDQEVYLGLDYYTESGSSGLYSPGATAGAKVVPVPANWTGELQFPLCHLRFMGGGYIRIVLARCKTAAAQGVSLPAGSEQLFEKKYEMVAPKR